MLERGEALPREGLFADDLQQPPLPAQAYTTLLAGEGLPSKLVPDHLCQAKEAKHAACTNTALKIQAGLLQMVYHSGCVLAGVEKVLPLVPAARGAQLLGGFAALCSRTPSKSPVKLACLRFMAGIFAQPAKFLRPGAHGEVPVPEAEAAQWLQVRLCAMAHST